MIQHILFATDGSFTAEQAGNFAASLAIRFHARITILHAFYPLPNPGGAHPNPVCELQANPQEAQALADKTAERLRDMGVTELDTQVMPGQPANVILGVAETLQPDIIILGARGLSTWQGTVLGSVAASVVNRAQVSVLVVR